MRLSEFRKGLLGQFVSNGVIPAIAIVVILIGVSAFGALGSLRAGAKEHVGDEAGRVAAEIQGPDGEALALVSTMGRAIENGMFKDRAATIHFMRSVAQAHAAYEAITVIYEPNADGADAEYAASKQLGNARIPAEAMDASGRFAPTFERRATASSAVELQPTIGIEALVYYSQAKALSTTATAGKPFLTEPYGDARNLRLDAVMPITINGAFAGAVAIDRGVDTLSERLAGLAREMKLDILILTDEDRFVAAASAEIAGDKSAQAKLQALVGLPLDKTEWNTALRPLISQTADLAIDKFVHPLTNTQDIVAFQRVKESGWKVVVSYPQARLYSELWAELWPDFVVGFIGILLLAFSILRVAVMVVLRVRGVTISVSSTATEMAASSRQQEEVAQGFGASSSEIAAAVRQITATGSELLRKMEQLAAMASESAQHANEGGEGLRVMGHTMQELSSATTGVAERLAAINEKASSINAIVDTITKVADQTNLLSVNAAIEAEKAGESGRGFLVVAREIRRLADQTAGATLDIETTVRQMQGAVSGGVMEMDRFKEQVRRGVDNVGAVGLRLTQVIDRVSTVESRFGEVTEGMQSQVEGADQIRQAMEALAQNASRAREATSEFAQAAAILKESILSLRKIVGGDQSV